MHDNVRTNGKDPSLDGLEFDGDTVLCRVCGDKASGFHYGVHACEGCKGFFRRSIQQKIQYRPCLKNQQCNIMRVNRNRCQYCRLKKCIAVGMSRDAVRFGRVPKREKAKILEQMQKVNTASQVNVLSAILDNDTDIVSKVIKSHMQTCEFTKAKFKTFYEKTWHNQEFVSCPSHLACPLNPSPDQADGIKKWEEFSECFTPAIRGVVNFAKTIPGFQVFAQEDQVTLLKAGTFEVLLVHLACLFDASNNTMIFANGKLFRRVSTSVTNSAGFLLDSMFDFAERMNSLQLTDEEIALFSAIVIIAADRPCLRNPQQVERVQTKLMQALQSMVLASHPEDVSFFAKILMKIPDLRTLNTLHSEKLLGLTVPHGDKSADVKPKVEAESMDVSDVISGRDLHPGFSMLPPHQDPTQMGNYKAGEPIMGHQVAIEAHRQNQVVLETPYGTFHRKSPNSQISPGTLPPGEDDIRKCPVKHEQNRMVPPSLSLHPGMVLPQQNKDDSSRVSSRSTSPTNSIDSSYSGQGRYSLDYSQSPCISPSRSVTNSMESLFQGRLGMIPEEGGGAIRKRAYSHGNEYRKKMPKFEGGYMGRRYLHANRHNGFASPTARPPTKIVEDPEIEGAFRRRSNTINLPVLTKALMTPPLMSRPQNETLPYVQKGSDESMFDRDSSKDLDSASQTPYSNRSSVDLDEPPMLDPYLIHKKLRVKQSRSSESNSSSGRSSPEREEQDSRRGSDTSITQGENQKGISHSMFGVPKLQKMLDALGNSAAGSEKGLAPHIGNGLRLPYQPQTTVTQSMTSNTDPNHGERNWYSSSYGKEQQLYNTDENMKERCPVTMANNQTDTWHMNSLNMAKEQQQNLNIPTSLPQQGQMPNYIQDKSTHDQGKAMIVQDRNVQNHQLDTMEQGQSGQKPTPNSQTVQQIYYQAMSYASMHPAMMYHPYSQIAAMQMAQMHMAQQIEVARTAKALERTQISLKGEVGEEKQESTQNDTIDLNPIQRDNSHGRTHAPLNLSARTSDVPNHTVSAPVYVKSEPI